jgi:hypothetical protein
MTVRADNRRALAELIRTQHQVFVRPGVITELRAPNTMLPDMKTPMTCGGFYTDAEQFAMDAALLTWHAPGVYETINSVNAASLILAGRVLNRLSIPSRPPLTGDADIVRILRIPIDADPSRPDVHASSTYEEWQAALDIIRRVCVWLQTMFGVPDSALVTASSGNGGHANLLCDLEATEATSTLVRAVLRAVAAQFADDIVKIDTSIGNFGRIFKTYGTWARKGTASPLRPHRQARLITVPAKREPCPREVLERIARTAPDEPPAPPMPERTTPYDGPPFNLDEWLERYAVQLPRRGPWRPWHTQLGAGRKSVFRSCPFHSDHGDDRAAFIGELPGGIPVVRCLHERCSGKNWQTLRDLIEGTVVVEVE